MKPMPHQHHYGPLAMMYHDIYAPCPTRPSHPRQAHPLPGPSPPPGPLPTLPAPHRRGPAPPHRAIPPNPALPPGLH